MIDPLEDKLREECGVFGIWGHPEAARLAYLGLYALQHRGQESAGIVATDGEGLRLEKGMGLVNDVFTDERLERLSGDGAMGHVRYSTAGDTVNANAQPILIECHRGPIALAHNGNLVNAAILRQELEAAGSIFQSTSDTEVILHLYARSHREKLEDAIAASLSKVMGAFSLLFLTKDALVTACAPAVRSRPSPSASASSSTSTSRGPTARSSDGTCSPPAWPSAASSRER